MRVVLNVKGMVDHEIKKKGKYGTNYVCVAVHENRPKYATCLIWRNETHWGRFSMLHASP
jgi:hypothetical protein